MFGNESVKRVCVSFLRLGVEICGLCNCWDLWVEREEKVVSFCLVSNFSP